MKRCYVFEQIKQKKSDRSAREKGQQINAAQNDC